MEKDKNYEECFDSLFAEALEEYFDEEVKTLEKELSDIPEPAYSLKYRRFVNNLIGKTVHPVNNWKKWTCIAAAFFGIIIFVSHEGTASYREIYKNQVTEETDVSFNIKLKPMYIEYDLSNIPKEWEYVFLPNDIMPGFKVEEMNKDSDIIEVLYSDKEGHTVKFSLYHQKMDFLKDSLEKIEINDMFQCYISYENKVALIMETEIEGVFYTILIESDTIETEDMIWIAKNLQMVKSGDDTSYYKE